MRDVDVAVAARDAAVLVVALFPEADHLGAEVGLEHARQHQDGRHRRPHDLVRAAVGAHRRGRGVHRLGRGRQGAVVEGRGDPLVGIEHDHPHAQAAARAEADAALREQRGQELPVGVAEQQGRFGGPAELGPRRGRGGDGRCRRPRPAARRTLSQAAIRAANWPASRLPRSSTASRATGSPVNDQMNLRSLPSSPGSAKSGTRSPGRRLSALVIGVRRGPRKWWAL